MHSRTQLPGQSNRDRHKGWASRAPLPFGQVARAELSRWGSLFREVQLAGLVLLALLVALVAYQVRTPLAVDVGGSYDSPYLRGFYEREPDRRVDPSPPVNFRWTSGSASVRLLGVGRQDGVVRLGMQAYRPEGKAQPVVSFSVRGQELFTTTVSPATSADRFPVYEFPIPADLLSGGDLRLSIRTQTFQPAGDPRELGITVDRVQFLPAPSGWGEPAWLQVGCLAGIALLLYLLLRRWGLSRIGTTLLATTCTLVLAWLLAYHRLGLTYFTPTLLALLGAGVLLTALFLPAMEHSAQFGKEARLLWAILLLGFLIRLGAMVYPQALSSDLMMNVHDAELVRTGNLFFTELLPDINLPAPYPPGLYITLLPANLASADLSLLFKIGGAALDALSGLLLYLLARRLIRPPAGAFLALLLQEAAPFTLRVFSLGNFANMFSRTAILAALTLLILGRWQQGQRRGWLLLAGTFVLVLLGHFADSLLFGLFALLVLLLGLTTWSGRRAVPSLLAALLAAGGVALLLYYTAPTVWQSFLGLATSLAGGQGRLETPGLPLDQFLRNVGTPLALLALPGIALLSRRADRWPVVVLGAALLTAFAFGLAQAFLGLASRYAYFIVPVLALGTGAILAELWKKGWAGRLVMGGLVVFALWAGLSSWFNPTWWFWGY